MKSKGSFSDVLRSPMTFRVIFSVAVIGVLALSAPIIWSAVNAGIGLTILAGIGIVGFGVIQALPLFGQKLENKILQLRKDEARRRPIEQLQNRFRRQAQQLEKFRQATVSIAAQIKTMQEMVAARKQVRPEYDSTAKETAIQLMKNRQQMMVGKYITAQKALEDFEMLIQDKEFDLKFSDLYQEAKMSMSNSSDEDIIEKMLADEAMKSIAERYNEAFADLELEVQTLSQAEKMSFDTESGLELDLTGIDLTAVKVGAKTAAARV